MFGRVRADVTSLCAEWTINDGLGSVQPPGAGPPYETRGFPLELRNQMKSRLPSGEQRAWSEAFSDISTRVFFAGAPFLRHAKRGPFTAHVQLCQHFAS
jgi:hypothetical protein